MAHSTLISHEEKMRALTLFGGDEGWNANDWKSSDDRVRGGKSESHLEITDDGNGRFYGNLDIETLGGAGFASLTTTADSRTWDLDGYAGIQLDIAEGDKKRYTFIVKDQLPPPKDDKDARQEATISWECDFDLPPESEPGKTHNRRVFIPWASFNPTYRGKVKKDAAPLKKQEIKRFSIMMRSFFGSQSGDFSLSIASVSAVRHTPPHGSSLQAAQLGSGIDSGKLEAGLAHTGHNDRHAGAMSVYQNRYAFAGLVAVLVLTYWSWARRNLQ